MSLRRLLLCRSAIAAFSYIAKLSPTISYPSKREFTSVTRRSETIRSAERITRRRTTSIQSSAQNSSGGNNGKARQGPHPRNAFKGSYDMEKLCEIYPPLADHIIRPDVTNKKGNRSKHIHRPTIKFADPKAVRALNTALLVEYGIAPNYATILPKDALVPPVPGRADYIHYIADVLSESFRGDIPHGSKIRGCDIGTGASLIYPLLAHAVYGWNMVGSEVHPSSVQSALDIIEANDLQLKIEVREQTSTRSIFDGIWGLNEEMDFVMCNPPFFSSVEAFQAENDRKVRGLAKGGANKRSQGKRKARPDEINITAPASNNFEGTSSELWCDGGEVTFVTNMIHESKRYAKRCLWFTSLVSRKENLQKIEQKMKKCDDGSRIVQIRKITMGAGTKTASIIMWTFMDEMERLEWVSRQKLDKRRDSVLGDDVL